MKKNILRFVLVPHFVLSTLIFCLVSAFVLFMQTSIWGPSQSKFQTISAQNENLKMDLVILRSRIDLSDRSIRTREILDRLDQKISSGVSQAELVAESSNFASRSNVHVLHSDNIVQRGNDGIAWFQQDITVEGSFHAIRNLLRLVEGSQRLTLIQQVDWTTTRDGQQKARIKLTTLIREET